MSFVPTGVSDVVLERLLDQVGARITDILATTRDTVRDEIVRGLDEGEGAAQLGDRIEAAAAFDEYRAETIARTETATLLNQAAMASYREFGVTHVTVIDGEEDDECAEANGQVWTIEEAEANPIAHPNCVRDFAPIVGEVPAEAAPEEAPPTEWPAPDTSKEGVEDATSAWTGIHYADLREYQMTGHVREGFSLIDDPIHGISEERAAQSVSTLTELIADGVQAPHLSRGIPVDDDALAHFLGLKQGDTLDLALSSWSSDRDEAIKFATRGFGEAKNPVLLEADGVQGFDMSKFSFYPGEKEWITDGRFLVNGVEERDGMTVVHLAQEAVWDAPKGGLR